MKNYYHVSFKYSENTFCANIAHAETPEDVHAHYSKKYDWVAVTPAAPIDVESAQRKGMPIVEVPHHERLGTLARDINSMFFDIDPWNGMDEDEGMESIVNYLVEDRETIVEELQRVIDDEDLKEYKETAEKLKERVILFCLG